MITQFTLYESTSTKLDLFEMLIQYLELEKVKDDEYCKKFYIDPKGFNRKKLQHAESILFELLRGKRITIPSTDTWSIFEGKYKRGVVEKVYIRYRLTSFKLYFITIVFQFEGRDQECEIEAGPIFISPKDSIDFKHALLTVNAREKGKVFDL